MARYRPILVRIWEDPDFQQYSKDRKLLFIYLFANPGTTESGIYIITPETIAHDTKLSMKSVNTMLKNTKNILYDFENKCVFVVNFMAYNRLGNPQLILKSIAKDIETTRTWLWSKFQERYPRYFEKILSIVKSKDNILPCDGNAIIDSDHEVESKDGKMPGFVKPTIDEIRAYCKERKNNVDAEKFYNFYESKGWMIGKNKMRDWRAAVCTWEKNSDNKAQAAVYLNKAVDKITNIDKAKKLLKQERTTSAMIRCLSSLPSEGKKDLIKWIESDADYLLPILQRAKKLFEGKKP